MKLNYKLTQFSNCVSEVSRVVYLAQAYNGGALPVNRT